MDINRNKRYKFETGETVCFKISYKVLRNKTDFTISIGLLSGLSRMSDTGALRNYKKYTFWRNFRGEVETGLIK